jgi:Trypsin-like peptidase domain
VRFAIGYFLAAALLAPLGGAQAQEPADASLRLYGVNIGASYGIYLGQGLIITAAHVASSDTSVRIANLELPAKAIKVGAFEQVDLTLLAIDQERLPVSLRLRRMPLCQTPTWPGEPVIVAIPEAIARSTILSPQLLPADIRTRFPTVIKDVATTGNSGSGVFDAARKCLLGIMSRKIFIRPKNAKGPIKERDLAKYFVPAATIAAFIPSGYRY